MQSSIFVVNEEPYCIWEVDLLGRNIEFLGGIDTEYFDYVIKVHAEAEDEKRASIALRTALYHAMETMFSLLGAYIQSPDCVYAWIAKCSNKDLRELVEKVSSFRNDLFTKLQIDKVSWDNVAGSVFRYYLPDTEKNKKTAQLFASLWNRLAHEYTDSNHIDEYNSIKHGFRIHSGGFALAIGLEHEYGVAPPPEEMKLVGKSEFGTSFFRVESIGEGKGNRSLRSRRISLNWKIERTILQLQLVSMSITNITSALKIANGVQPETCKFLRPQEDSGFEKPWSYSPGVTSFNMDFVISEDQVSSATKSELLKIITDAKKS
jgi:hypothetical protein